MPSKSRLQLHDLLLASLGNENVYFQPPSNIQMKYPCVVYKRKKVTESLAGGIKYSRWKEYDVTLISSKPDDPILETLLDIERSSFVTSFNREGLYHDQLSLLW
jgi:hypothetical protein